MLSAKAAVFESKFFDSSSNKAEAASDKPTIKSDAREAAKKLPNNHIVWLDVLDLEPLAKNANLLTTMLTRVRNALHKSGCGECDNVISAYEEKEDSAQKRLSRLINKSALLWENIQEPDTRSRANREIDAADIYASYRQEFREAVDKLVSELGRIRGNAQAVHIILPIDNIDRSTEHLASIVKLAQMVSHTNIWLVMAGDQQDIDIFLERAFWKELISVG